MFLKKIATHGYMLFVLIVVVLAIVYYVIQSHYNVTSQKDLYQNLEQNDDDFVISPKDGTIVHPGTTVNLVLQAPSGKSFSRVFIEFLPFPGPQSTTSPFTLPLAIPNDFSGRLTFIVQAQTTDGSKGFDVFTLNVQP